MKDNSHQWLQTHTDVFLDEIAPCDHLVQIYQRAKVQLEHVWNKFCKKQAFSLFSVYLRSGFTEKAGLL